MFETDKFIAAGLFVASMILASVGYMRGIKDFALFAGGFATFWSGSLSTLLLTRKNGGGTSSNGATN